MEGLRPNFVFYICLVYISGTFGSSDDKFDPSTCPPNFSIWPPQDQLECRAPPHERSWPPSDYVEVHELSFYKYYKFGTDWFTANRVCQEDGAHLVIVDSEREAMLMKHMFTENRDVLGANSLDHMWLGIHERGVHGKYHTIFGDKVEDLGYVIPWQAGQPNDPALDDCATIINTGVLYDDGCFMKYPFVCEIERSAVKYVKDHPKLHYVPETTCNGQSCHGQDGHRSIYWTDLNSPYALSWSPKDYLVDCKGSDLERSFPPHEYIANLQQRSYYKVHAYGTHWFDALNVCKQEGAHLLIISSEVEAAAIRALMDKFPNVPGSVNARHIWLGVHERGTHAQYVTPFGDPQEYLTWTKNPAQPNNPGVDDVMSFHSLNGLYDDEQLFERYHFICEIEMSLVESLRNSSKQKYIFSPYCNDRTCSDRPNHSIQEPELLKPTIKIDARSKALIKATPKPLIKATPKPLIKATPKPSVGKKPIKVVARPSSKPSSQVQSDSAFVFEWEHMSLIKSLVLNTNYSAPDLRCQHIPLGGFCRTMGCSTAQPTSCGDHKESTLLHSMFDEIKAIKQQLAQATSPTGKLLTFPGTTGRATPPPKRKP